MGLDFRFWIPTTDEAWGDPSKQSMHTACSPHPPLVHAPFPHPQSLRQAVGVVPQDCVLFNDSVMQNIRCGLVPLHRCILTPDASPYSVSTQGHQLIAEAGR